MGNFDAFFEHINDNLPMIFDRETAAKTLGGILGKKTLANADAAGNGPAVKLKIGKKIVYERASFIEWLKSRVR